MCTNIVKFYHKENIQLELLKILDDLKKNLQKVAHVNSGFNITYRNKAQELNKESWFIVKTLTLSSSDKLLT